MPVPVEGMDGGIGWARSGWVWCRVWGVFLVAVSQSALSPSVSVPNRQEPDRLKGFRPVHPLPCSSVAITLPGTSFASLRRVSCLSTLHGAVYQAACVSAWSPGLVDAVPRTLAPLVTATAVVVVRHPGSESPCSEGCWCLQPNKSSNLKREPRPPGTRIGRRCRWTNYCTKYGVGPAIVCPKSRRIHFPNCSLALPFWALPMLPSLATGRACPAAALVTSRVPLV